MIVIYNIKEHTKENITKISPNTHGIYFIYNENKEIVYIGSSCCIEERLFKHELLKPKYFSIFIIDNPRKREKIEKFLIEKYIPKFNMIYNKKFNVYRNYGNFIKNKEANI